MTADPSPESADRMMLEPALASIGGGVSATHRQLKELLIGLRLEGFSPERPSLGVSTGELDLSAAAVAGANDNRFDIEFRVRNRSGPADALTGVGITVKADTTGFAVRYLAIVNDSGHAVFRDVPSAEWSFDTFAPSGRRSGARTMVLPMVRRERDALAAAGGDDYAVIVPAGALYRLSRPGAGEPYILEIVCPADRTGIFPLSYRGTDGRWRELLIPIMPVRSGSPRSRVRLREFSPDEPWETGDSVTLAELGPEHRQIIEDSISAAYDRATIAAWKNLVETAPPQVGDIIQARLSASEDQG
ncbi:hypothetical protein [Acrocarpospora sp. B8E8]|uniref:hypothetical protein n=1 Tax=Acrocarpospora sp. B8E8 TaxID=3153572 RepID=UPI00325C57E1